MNHIYSVIFVVQVFLHGQAFSQLQMTGTVKKDNKTEIVSFDLQISSDKPDIRYSIKGTTATKKGLYRSDLDYSGIKIKKTAIVDGKTLTRVYENKGLVQVYPRKRFFINTVFAGIAVEGDYIQGFFDDGLWFKDLTVAGKKSSGSLDHNMWNGHYNSKGKCSFGDCQVLSSLDGQIVVFDHDDLIGQNSTTVTMLFSDLKVEGINNFSDVTETAGSGDDKTTTVVATAGHFNLKISKKNSSEIILTVPTSDESKDSVDDISIRKLIAFFQVVGFDIFAE